METSRTILPPDRKQQKRQDRQTRACDRDPEQRAVEIEHRARALEIADPEDLVEQHQKQRRKKPERPRRQGKTRVEIGKDHGGGGHEHFPDPLEREQDAVLVFRVPTVVFGLPLRPQKVRNEKQEQPDQPDIGKPETQKRIPPLGLIIARFLQM